MTAAHPEQTEGRILSTDKRGRATIGPPERQYLMHEQADGTLVLEPAVVMTELERRFLANTRIQSQLAYADEHPEQQVLRRRRRLDD